MSEPSKSLSPDTLLFLEQVRQRYKTRKKAAFFQDDMGDLVIMFDTKPQPDWMLYGFTQEIFPNVSMVLNPDMDICGVYIAFDISEYMSLRLYMEYGRVYEAFASRHNRFKSQMPIEVIWDYITEFYVVDQSEDMRNLYEEHEEFLRRKIIGTEVWVLLYEEVTLTMH